MCNFLLFSPFNSVPLGSLDSDVRGLPSFNGALTKSMENILLPASHMNSSMKPDRKQRNHIHPFTPERVAGSMLVLGKV